MTNEQRIAALEIYKAVAEAIRDLSAESPLGGVPAGELYAMLCGRMTLATFDSMTDSMERAGLISKKNFLLRWTADRDMITSVNRES